MEQKDVENTVKYAQFLINTREAFLRNYREEFGQLLKYGETLMSIFGVLAGFGFTAFQFIKNQNLFFIGESCVIFSILYLFFRAKTYIGKQAQGTENWINDSVNKVREMKTALIQRNLSEIKKFSDEFNNNVNDISTNIPLLVAAKKMDIHLGISFWVGLFGIISILSSFYIQHI